MARVGNQAWRSWIFVALAVPVLVIAAIVTFVRATTTPPLHPNSKEIPSVVRSTPPPRWAGAVEQSRQVARSALVGQNLPGLSVAVGVRDDIVWAEGFGWADLKTRVPVAPELRFRIGHVSKALTSAAVGLLLEDHRLNLDDQIQTYVTAFPKKQWPITLRQLMAHTAGVTHYKDTEWGDRPTMRCERASQGLATFANDPLLFEPGTQYRYSTYGWVLVSAAVEAVANEPFFAFMRRRIFTALDMAATTSDVGDDPMPDRVTPYFGANFGLQVATGVDFSCFAGAGGFLSTPSDLVRFGLAMRGGKLLQPSTVHMLQSPQLLDSGEETGYGLGWMLETLSLAGEPTRMAGHAARTVRGGTTSLMTFPDRGLVVVVMANISLADTKSVALAIAQAFSQN